MTQKKYARKKVLVLKVEEFKLPGGEYEEVGWMKGLRVTDKKGNQLMIRCGKGNNGFVAEFSTGILIHPLSAQQISLAPTGEPPAKR